MVLEFIIHAESVRKKTGNKADMYYLSSMPIYKYVTSINPYAAQGRPEQDLLWQHPSKNSWNG
jgi:hypothetical protein